MHTRTLGLRTEVLPYLRDWFSMVFQIFSKSINYDVYFYLCKWNDGPQQLEGYPKRDWRSRNPKIMEGTSSSTSTSFEDFSNYIGDHYSSFLWLVFSTTNPVTPGDADISGIALAPGESCAMDARTGAAFQIAIREQLLGSEKRFLVVWLFRNPLILDVFGEFNGNLCARVVVVVRRGGHWRVCIRFGL